MMRRHLLITCLFLVNLISPTWAQNNKMDNSYQQQWKQADSLKNKGLPQSASKIVEDLLKDAFNKKNTPQVIKAQLFLMSTLYDREENATIQNIKSAETYAAQTSGAEKAIWQSIAAQLYWQYFQNNRWNLYQRTTLEQTLSEDIATWDAAAFFKKTGSLYQASLAEREVLKNIPVAQYAPIILEGKNTSHLRATLYDFLAFRALAFFEHDEKDIINPSYQFQMEGSLWFDPAAQFSTVKVKPRDATALHFQALRLYQDIIGLHLQDDQPDALVDADLQRLEFVRKNSVHPDKDSLYLAALRHLENKYRDRSIAAEISYRIAAQEAGNTGNYTLEPGISPHQQNRNLPAIKRKLESIMAQYPDTEGAIHAHNLLEQLQTKTLSLKAEEVTLPGENSKALVSYKNIARIYVHLFRVPSELKYTYEDQEQLLARLKQLSPVRLSEQSLPGTEDMELHTTEIKVEALPQGSYILVISSAKTLEGATQLIAATPFQVSPLSFIINGENNSIYVLHRKSGQPIPDATVTLYEQRYHQKKRIYEPVLAGKVVTDKEGKALLPATNNGYAHYNAISITRGSDTLWHQAYINTNYRQPAEETRTQTFFFTDRAIYRPGQTIYFKGIKVQSSNKNRKNETVAHQKTNVTFYDVNGQKIQSLALTTNEYGSFSGSFTAPEGLLTGQMRLSDDNGSAYFSVEEYKRPKFYVAYDTLKDNYALNRPIEIKGFAKAYAGNNIDGATVKYRVVRNARFPYYWRFYRWGAPASPEMEIANGSTRTEEDGSFTIMFNAIPDKTINEQTLPVFTYTLYADITDINGETRSGSTSVQAGYRSLIIAANIKELSAPKDLDHIKISTRNLNGVFTPAVVKISIAPLKFPGKLYRKRLWEQPDQYIMTEKEFRNFFPDDEYAQESDYLTWEKGKEYYQKTETSTKEGLIPIPAGTWAQNGWYVIELSGKDPQGNDVLEKVYTYVLRTGQNDPVQKDLLTYTPKEQYQPGEKAELWVLAGRDKPYLIPASSHPAGNGNKNPVTFPITEAERGGITFSCLYVQNNRVYQAQHLIPVPWSNKELHLEWATHRDKLLPGAAEEWTLTLKGDKKEKVAAEVLAGMYDASLDAFAPHQWLRHSLFPSLYPVNYWRTGYTFGLSNSILLQDIGPGVYREYEKRYDELAGLDWEQTRWRYGQPRSVQLMGKRAGNEARMEEVAVTDAAAPAAPEQMQEEQAYSTNKETPPDDPKVAIRSNLNETAFFFPQLATDKEGNVTFRFTLPEALTEWKMMAFAHTPDWKTGYLEGKVQTQKDLMVMPNLPRFLRQGDEIVLSTKIVNLSTQALNGTANIELLNALTLQPVHLPFRLQETTRTFSVPTGQSTTATWTVHVPESLYDPVVLRITAKAGNFTDGEETTVPLITNRMLVTETLPLPVRGQQEQTFSFTRLKENTSNSLVHRSLTVEFTGNPAWYAVQALPYLMDYPYECAEQTFNRYYANALAGHIIAQSPKVKAIFDQWKHTDTAALLSNLEKNQELKSALLEETPWVMEAKNETEQKRRIARLFETHQLGKELDRNLNKLAEMQLPEGGFPWFKGMRSDRYITQYIATGLARLQHLGIANASKGKAQSIINKALPYLDEQIKKDYDDLIKSKAKPEQQHISYAQIQYLYLRSFNLNQKVAPATEKAFQYYKAQAAQYWHQFNPFMKGTIALSLHRFKDKVSSAPIMASLKELAIHDKEMGMYWKTPQGYWWYEAPIEAQALLIEAFTEITKDTGIIDDLKTWLLKQKQTQNWKTTKATADACYALLLGGSDWISQEADVTIQLGTKTIRSSAIKTEAGTGYFKERIEGPAVHSDMGDIKVRVVYENNPSSTLPAWGAVYWQYFEQLDKITGAATPLALKKQLYIERNSDRGPVLTEINEGNALKIGDKVLVRILLQVDRDMDYVHLKDMRAACFEPVNVLSQYKYQGGLGYYESTKDVATNFFFDRLRKGTYVFEYPVFVTAQGDFSNGIATIQCMYAPEFSSHSEGIRVNVQ